MTPEPDSALDDAWSRLERLVDWTTDFYLAFIFSSSPEAVGILRDRSRSVLEKSGRRMRVFHPEKPADVLAVVAAIAQPESKKSNCFWLDTVAVDSSDPTYELWREGYDQLILRLNESRQGLRTHLGGGLVLALPHWYKSIIAPAASDLWSIRTLTIDLPGTPAKAPLPSINIADFVMPPVRLDEGPTLDPDMCKDQARRLAQRGEGARPAMIANLLRAAEGYLDRDRARESLGMAQEAEALLQGVAPNLLGPDHATALVAMAAAEEALGDFVSATKHATEAIQLRQGNVERDMLHVYGIAERIALRREDVRAAREAAEGALVVAKARHAESPQDVEAKNDLLAILERVGPLRRALGDAQGARQAADEALALRGGVEEPSMTRIEAIRPSAQLPPIVERLPEGEEGGSDFAHLMCELIRGVSGIPPFLRHHGPTWGPLNDFIYRIGISFPGRHDEISVIWSRDDIRQGAVARALTKRIAELAPVEDDYEVEETGKQIFPFIFPRYLTLDEKNWLEGQPKSSQVSVEARDMSHVADLLRPVPALFARYYPELAAGHLPGFVPFDFRAFARHYCAEIVRDKQYVHLLGFPPDALREKDAKAHIRLADLFVPTVFREQKDRDQRTALAELLNAESSVLVLGDPGMGKTMLLTFLALLHADGAAKLDGYTPPPKRIPLFVSLREYALEDQAHNLSLLEYLAKRCSRFSELRHAHPAFFEASLRMGEAIVLLDGLDEVGSSAARKRMADRVRELRREYPDCPVWVTSRIHGYTHDIALPQDEFHHVLIGALDDAQVDDFLTRWYQIQLPDDPQKQADNKNSLRQAIFRTEQVRALASNPLLLTLMAFVHRFLGHLPQDRGELYEQCVNMLLRSWLDARERPEKHAFEHLGLATELPRGYLEALAFHVQEHGLLADDEASGARGLFSKDDALAFLTTHHLETDRRDPSISPLKAREEMREFVDYACDRVGLLVDRGGGKLSFLHLSFQEYLAASFDTVMTTIRDQETVFVKRFRDPAWSEVLLLRLYLFARKRDRAGLNMFDELVRALLDELERCDDITGWLLLGRALRDRHDIRPSQRRVMLERLVRAWATEPMFEGDVFVVLEDIRVFATDVVQAELRAACAQVQSSGSPAQAVAALHLEEKLFGGVEGAAKRFAARADLSDLLADLVAFHDVPEFAALLAEKSTPDHWETALEALDCEDAYRWSLGWATGAIEYPAKSDTPILAATRWMRRRIDAEVESREQFAAKYHDHFNAILFERPGILRVKGEFYQLRAPLAFATILPRVKTATSSFQPTLTHQPDLFHRLSRTIATKLWHSKAAVIDRLTPIIKQAASSSSPDGAIHHETVSKVFVLEFLNLFGESFNGKIWHHFSHIFWKQGLTAMYWEYADELARITGRSFGTDTLCQLVRVPVTQIISGVATRLGSEFGRTLVSALGYDSEQIDNNVLAAWFQPNVPISTTISVTTPGHRLSWEVGTRIAIPALLASLCTVWAMTWLLSVGRHLHVSYPDGNVPRESWDGWFQRHPRGAFWTALAWNEHTKLFQQNHGKLDGPLGALMLAHADYASLMTGLDLENAEDYRIWKALVEAAGPALIEKLRRFVSASAPAQPPSPAPVPIPKPAPAPEPAPLFTFLHLSDMHFGLPKAGDRHNQSTVLAALRDEFSTWSSKSLPRPDAIFITGDIAWAGKASDYDAASKWLDEILKILGLTSDRVFVVPGNHDLDRDVDTDRNVKRLMRLLRDGDDVDEALADEGDRDLLLRRKDAYLQFAKRFSPACHHPDIAPLQRLAWTHREQARGNLAVHIVGFDTALLAAGNDDPKKLRLGQAQIALLNDCAPDREFVVVLGHHPFNGEWLHPDEERDAATLVRRRAHVYLAGHVHEHDSAQVISGGGTELLRIVAGAIYGGRQKDIPQGHAYSVGAVMPPFEGKPVRLRVHPRRFSFKQGDFRTDIDNVLDDGKPYAEFDLHRLKP